MGTSTSSRGSGGKSPLVPPWADTDGKGPGPEPPPKRFGPFRRQMGDFVSSGDTGALRKALGHYARTATGGRAVGPRRFGSMVQVGGALFDALATLQTGAIPPDLELETLDGIDVDVAIQALVEALLPENGDAERIRVAIIEAMSECLEGFEEFDFSKITHEMVVKVVVAYLSACVFGQVMLESNRAFSKAAEAGRLEQAENDMRSLVRASVDKHLHPALAGRKRLSGKDVEQAQRRALTEVWTEWEAYES